MEIYGILNVTPDSFSDGGDYTNLELALQQVELMVKQGATVIDVGGESTRPGAEFVDSQTEIERVVPIIKKIKHNFDVEVSIDTYKSEVAKAAVIAGADIINDVQANAYDGHMLEVVKQYNVKYVAMHSRKCSDVLADIRLNFDQIIEQARQLSIKPEQIILDPGIGFNKDIDDNLTILKNLKQLRNEYSDNEFLLGTSRKRFIGTINNLPEAKDRVIGTTVTSVLAVQAGYNYVRVHDVLANKQAIDLALAVENHE